MTNEVVNAAGTAANGTIGLTDVLNAQLSQGQELWNQILTWISERGLVFAINLLTAFMVWRNGEMVVDGKLQEPFVNLLCGLMFGIIGIVALIRRAVPEREEE